MPVKPTPSNPADREVYRDRMFVALVVAATLAFAYVAWPMAGAVFWAVVLAILFTPVFRRIAARLNERRTLAAILTILLAVAIVIVPVVIVTAMLAQEAGDVYARLRSGELAPGRLLEQALGVLPAWARSFVERLGFGDVATIQERLTAGAQQGVKVIGAQAVNVGQNAVEFVVGAFVMIYVLFYLLRDGRELYARIRNAVPLRQDIQQELFPTVAGAVRATVKGRLIVCVVQGAIGGITFALLGFGAPVLWGVAMGFAALVPAFGTALVWLPAALYLLATGAVTQGVALLAVGALVISMVDNFLAPRLVGKDTRMPDWIVLIAVLGGIAVFGITGVVAGPAIAALFLATWHVAEQSRKTP
jgi:predicted PurR-regulated permease PerM